MNTPEMNDELFLFDRPWFPKVFRIARENHIDWLRICAAAEVLSNGDPHARMIDWDFLNDKMGMDNPVFLPMYDGDQPSAEIIDRATRWGLFQVLGEEATRMGYSGRLINLTDVVKNTMLICQLYLGKITLIEEAAQQAEITGNVEKANEMRAGLPLEAEVLLGWDTKAITTKVSQLREQIGILLEIGD